MKFADHVMSLRYYETKWFNLDFEERQVILTCRLTIHLNSIFPREVLRIVL